MTMNSVSLLPPSEASFLSFSLVYALFSVHSASDQMQSLNVNLQVVELERHIYGMKDVIGRGVTKDRRTILLYLSRAVHYRLCGARSGSPQLLLYIMEFVNF